MWVRFGGVCRVCSLVSDISRLGPPCMCALRVCRGAFLCWLGGWVASAEGWSCCVVLWGVGLGGLLAGLGGLVRGVGCPVWVPGWVPCRTLSEWGIGKVQGALLEGCYSPA